MLKNYGELVPLLLINAILLIYFLLTNMLFRRWRTNKYLVLVLTSGISFLVYAIFTLLRMFQDSALGDLRLMLGLLNTLEVFAMIVLMGSFHFLSPKNKKNLKQLAIVTGSLLLLSTISIFMKGTIYSILFLLISGSVFYVFFWLWILPLLTKKKYFFIAIGAQFMAMVFQLIYVLSHSPMIIIGCFLFQAIFFASMLLAFFERILDLVQIALQQSATQSSFVHQVKPEEESHKSDHYEPETEVTEIPYEVELVAQSSSILNQIKPEEESHKSNHPESKTKDTELPNEIELKADPPAQPEVLDKNETFEENEIQALETDSNLKKSGSVTNIKHPFVPKEGTKVAKNRPIFSKTTKSKEDFPAKAEEEPPRSRQIYSEDTWFERIPKLNEQEKEELEKILEAKYREHYGDRDPKDTATSAIQVNEETTEVSEEKEGKPPFLRENEKGMDEGIFINPFKKNEKPDK